MSARVSPKAPAAAAVAGTIAIAIVLAIGALAPAASLAAPTSAAASPAAVSPATVSPATVSALAGGPAARPRASLPEIESRVMCVTCKIPLLVAESPQAERERVYIRGLIGEGLTVAQIERALVSQYGPAVLGLPSAHGFDETAYLVPLAAMLALAATLALLLPRWRRRAGRSQITGSSLDGRSGEDAAPVLTAADTARLDADLARFDP